MIRSAVAFLLLLPLAAATVPAALTADPEGRFVYVADAAGDRVTVLATASGRVVRRIGLPESPSGIALDGSTLFVTGASAQGSVYLVDATTGDLERTVPAGHMPRSPVLSPDGGRLYVLNRFENVARVIDLDGGDAVTTVALPREPIAAALTPGGETLLVLNHLPTGPATAAVVAAEVSFIDTRSGCAVTSVKLTNGSTSARGICLSPDGRFAFCTHVLARFHNPATQLVRGWINTNALGIIDVRRRELYATVLLDDVDLGAANPWGVACSADGTTLAVTHAGAHEVSLIDLPGLLERLAGLDDRARAGVADELSFLGDLRRRVALEGRGPRAAVFARSDLYVAERFSGSVSVVGADGGVRSTELGPETPTDVVARGEMLFHDARLCFQGWQSCASCHPDGRADALNWDLLNDGFGNPKNTKSLLHAHETPPAMILGVRPDAEAAVRAGLRHVLLGVRPEADLQAIDAYLKSMRPVPSPYLVDGRPGPAAERGRVVFAEAGCDACHTGPLFTDLQAYDLGMGLGQDTARPMDTPTLIEVWRTAPYLHDGRAADLRSVLVMHNPRDLHGQTSRLTEAELEDLLAYLLSL